VNTRFILIEPSHAGNVGAVARAMKVMGFSDLVLVAPRWDDVLTRQEAIDRASGATDVLGASRIVPALDDALDGVQVLCATAMTPRDFGPPTAAPRAHLPGLAASGASVGFLFGSERYGMRNEDVYRCHVALSIPTAADYGSLNLAAAVQLIAYEWRHALGGFPAAASGAAPAADAQALAGMLAHWEEALTAIGFLDPAAPKKLMPRLNQMFNRAQPTPEEVHILRGVAKAMLQAGTRTKS
jgi:tRNA/rRNA methyltransferase